jgi:hypothetical protein
MGAVTVSAQYVQMRRSEITRRKNDFSFLAPLSAPLTDALRIVSAPISRAAPLIQRLDLPVATEVELAIVKDRCIERATSMIDGLRNSMTENVTLPRSRRNAAYSFAITVLLAEKHTAIPRR